MDPDTHSQTDIALDPLPPGFINELFELLWSSKGDEIVTVMLESLYELTPQQQSSRNKAKNNPNKKTFGQPKDLTEVETLQDFIFSNISHLDDTSFPHRTDLILAGRLPNLAQLEIDIHKSNKITSIWNSDEKFSWILMANLPKLQSLVIHCPTMRLCSSRALNPFESLTGPIILPSLESITIEDSDGYLDVQNTIKTLFTHCSFPKLKNVQLPLQFINLKDGAIIKALLNLLPVIPSLKNYQCPGSYSFARFSSEFFAELSLLPPSKFSNIVSILDWPTEKSPSLKSSRDRLLSTANLQSLTQLSLDGAFFDQDDLDKTSEWLFKMEWMKNITHLKLPNRFLSSSSAFNIASSPHLINLKILESARVIDSSSKQSINIILQSPNLSNLTTLQLPNPTPDHFKIITTSPHLSGITTLDLEESLLPYLSSMASSKTLCNLQSIELEPTDEDYDDPSTLAGFVAYFHSPNIQQLTKLTIDFRSPPPPGKVSDLMSFVSSPHITKLTHLTVRGVRMPEVLRPLFSNPAFSNLKCLYLYDCHLNDDDIEALSSSPYLKNLTFLDLSGNNSFTDQSLAYISKSPNVTNLTHLSLSRAGLSPFSDNALNELFRSEFITMLEHLSLPFHPMLNFDAIGYLINKSHIFNQDREQLPFVILKCEATPAHIIFLQEMADLLNVKGSLNLSVCGMTIEDLLNHLRNE